MYDKDYLKRAPFGLASVISVFVAFVYYCASEYLIMSIAILIGLICWCIAIRE